MYVICMQHFLYLLVLNDNMLVLRLNHSVSTWVAPASCVAAHSERRLDCGYTDYMSEELKLEGLQRLEGPWQDLKH